MTGPNQEGRRMMEDVVGPEGTAPAAPDNGEFGAFRHGCLLSVSLVFCAGMVATENRATAGGHVSAVRLRRADSPGAATT